MRPRCTPRSRGRWWSSSRTCLPRSGSSFPRWRRTPPRFGRLELLAPGGVETGHVELRRVVARPALAQRAVVPLLEHAWFDAVQHGLAGGHGKVFAGQRQEGFYVDLGSIFDLGALRPFQDHHLIPLPAAMGITLTKTIHPGDDSIQVKVADAVGKQSFETAFPFTIE